MKKFLEKWIQYLEFDSVSPLNVFHWEHGPAEFDRSSHPEDYKNCHILVKKNSQSVRTIKGYGEK